MGTRQWTGNTDRQARPGGSFPKRPWPRNPRMTNTLNCRPIIAAVSRVVRHVMPAAQGVRALSLSSVCDTHRELEKYGVGRQRSITVDSSSPFSEVMLFSSAVNLFQIDEAQAFLLRRDETRQSRIRSSCFLLCDWSLGPWDSACHVR